MQKTTSPKLWSLQPIKNEGAALPLNLYRNGSDIDVILSRFFAVIRQIIEPRTMQIVCEKGERGLFLFYEILEILDTFHLYTVPTIFF